jgi:hypothetical protein
MVTQWQNHSRFKNYNCCVAFAVQSAPFELKLHIASALSLAVRIFSQASGGFARSAFLSSNPVDQTRNEANESVRQSSLFS